MAGNARASHHGKSKKEEARTCRALHRGTAKRLSQETRQAAPIWARSVGSCDGLGKFAVFGAARSRSYAKLLIKLFLVRFYF